MPVGQDYDNAALRGLLYEVELVTGRPESQPGITGRMVRRHTIRIGSSPGVGYLPWCTGVWLLARGVLQVFLGLAWLHSTLAILPLLPALCTLALISTSLLPHCVHPTSAGTRIVLFSHSCRPLCSRRSCLRALKCFLEAESFTGAPPLTPHRVTQSG
jgi:hypothetical protein